MNISIGCDHAGPELKVLIAKHLANQGYTVINRGTDSSDSVDYPDFAHAVAEDVSSQSADLGILICGSANGVAMTANKHSDVRAAIAWIPEIATLARQHNNANIVCIPARFVSDEQAIEIIDCFFKSGFEGGRHARRVAKIACAMMASLVWMTASWSQTEAVPQQVVDVKLSQDDMRQHLSILASDAFEGRETGEAGQKKAANYLEAYYVDLGFEPCNNGSFFQKVPLENNQILGGTLVVLGDTLDLGEDFFLYPGLDITHFKINP